MTGANSGLGLATAREFARAGAHVVLAVRNTDKGEAAAASIAGSTEVRRLDLADLASVRRFADKWDRPIDILVNNAGLTSRTLGHTVDGFEMHMGTNHFGHFALTQHVLPLITDRIIVLASLAHRRTTMDLSDLGWDRRTYTWLAAYGQSKLANLLFASELQRRLTESRSPVKVVAAHPGWATTGLNLDDDVPVFERVMTAVGDRVVAQSPEAGAWPTLFAATADIAGGSYVGPDGRFETRGHPTLVGRSSEASDPELARRLWEVSERATST
ncbi:putative short-chain dehydrogenase/reductase [Rhodococcoides trifolii]|uniref:Short-chain dehydrogenase/reductase n=1 Tax=Rhodococcoides trifolii TaxID=908250 RepID=A0A917G0M6_9NOCA|nr:putative short-chain dehydrogenase/reductase [Rhodococcus trifolii]